MDLKQLKCFRAVMTTGAMTRAATALGVSQPTVSAIVGGLERELGFQLFERTKGTLRPTQEAFYFYEETVQVIDRLDRAIELAREIRRSNHGELTLLTYPGFAISFLPHVISEFRADRPDVRFKLISRNSDSLRRLLPAGQYDAAVVEVPAASAMDCEIFAFECVCALPAGHSLAAREVIKPKDLDGLAFIGLFQDHTTWHQLAAAFSHAGAHWNLVVECQFYTSAAAFVRDGAGCAVLDPITARQFDSADIVLRPFRPTIRYEIALLRPDDRACGQVAGTFLDLLREHLHRLQQFGP